MTSSIWPFYSTETAPARTLACPLPTASSADQHKTCSRASLPNTDHIRTGQTCRLDIRERAYPRGESPAVPDGTSTLKACPPFIVVTLSLPKSNWLPPNKVGQVWHSRGGTAVPPICRTYRRVGPTHYQKPTLP